MKYTERLFPDLSQSVASGRISSEGAKKRSLPFKAPTRVDSSSNTASMTSKSMSKTSAKPVSKTTVSAKASAAKAKSNGFKPVSKATVVLSSDEDSDELDDSPPKKKKKHEHRRRIEGDEENEDEEHEEEEQEEKLQLVQKPASRPKDTDTTTPIPQKLLTRLLYESFEDKNMKIAKEAMSVVDKYMETFVREALARAIYEREEADAELVKGTGDGFLQVEDLEKLAPQLLLDF